MNESQQIIINFIAGMAKFLVQPIKFQLLTERLFGICGGPFTNKGPPQTLITLYDIWSPYLDIDVKLIFFSKKRLKQNIPKVNVYFLWLSSSRGAGAVKLEGTKVASIGPL